MQLALNDKFCAGLNARSELHIALCNSSDARQDFEYRHGGIFHSKHDPGFLLKNLFEATFKARDTE